MAVQLSVEQVFAEITLAVTSQVKNNLSLVLYIQHSCLRTTLSALQVYIKAAYLSPTLCILVGLREEIF